MSATNKDKDVAAALDKLMQNPEAKQLLQRPAVKKMIESKNCSIDEFIKMMSNEVCSMTAPNGMSLPDFETRRAKIEELIRESIQPTPVEELMAEPEMQLFLKRLESDNCLVEKFVKTASFEICKTIPSLTPSTSEFEMKRSSIENGIRLRAGIEVNAVIASSNKGLSAVESVLVVLNHHSVAGIIVRDDVTFGMRVNIEAKHKDNLIRHLSQEQRAVVNWVDAHPVQKIRNERLQG